MEPTRARYWCEQAQLLDPQNPAVFNLRERLVASESNNPDDFRKLYLSELEQRPTDVGLRVRLLHHMLQNNQITEAYKHVSEIEQKNLPIFASHLAWYETVAKILVRYRNDNANNNTLTWEFWMLIVSVLDKLVSLCLDENLTTVKNMSECISAVFNLDQTLTIAAENVNANCMEKQFSQEFLIHYRAQLCFHIVTLVFKQAKKDQIKYKEAINLSLPLLLVSYHSQPVELQCVWLDHAQEQVRKQVQRWHREASFRCSQAGHTLQSLVKERRSSFADRVGQLCSGSWREKTYKNIFITRDQQMKMKSSYFVTCPQLEEITIRLPDSTELIRYDEVAQLVHPNSLHHMIWIGINSQPVKFRCTVFDGLQYSVRNLSNCAAETLNILDIQAFIYCCVFCAQSQIEESKHMIYYNQEKPNVLPASISEQLGTLNQTKWFASVYKMFRNECGSDLSDIRVTLIKGIEVVRCAGSHGLDVKLLVMLANTFAQKAKQLTKSSEIEFTEARAELYWKTALPLLEKLKNNQAISYPAKRWFEYRGKEMTPTEININLEEGKLFSAVQLMKKKDHEKALLMLESLKNPYASFYQAQTYKLLADEQMSHNKENVTSEMRSQHIILLSKSRDCLYLTLDRLREPAVDRKHPLNTELATEIEKIERLLSRIDPDICVNRNECDGMSDENVSSVGSVGEHVNMSSAYTLHSSYHNGNLTPRNDHHNVTATPYRNIDIAMNHSRRVEARPSPERLDAQLRQMAAAKDTAITHILEQNKLVMDAHRSLVDEIRSIKDAVTSLTSAVDELKGIKKSVDEIKVVVDDLQNLKIAGDQVYEIKKDLAELKKDTNKLKSSQINEEDLYALEEEYGVDYNINAGASGFNSAALYSNFPQRLQGANTLAYGAPGLYGMYPMYPYGGLGLGQPGALPFAEGHVPDFRAMGSIAQGLSHTGLTQSQTSLGQAALPMFSKLPTDANAFNKFDNSNLPLNTVPAPLLPQPPTTQAVLPPVAAPHQLPIQLPSTSHSNYTIPVPAPVVNPVSNKAPPVNVVITASDPLPTTSVSQPVLSVTIPPQHLKGNQQSKIQPHNYQIPLPATTQPTFSTVPSAITTTPMPVSTQNLLSNVAPPVYSSLSVKGPASNTSKGLGLKIEKSLTQSFGSPNASALDATQKSDMNRSNASESSIVDEHDPCPDFKPIIPLPDEVPLTTGEENEKVLFCEHAKLYRFVEKEWRERGVGSVKILHNEPTGKVRLLMRRDQVHKICANHFLTSDMTLTQMQKNERAYIWAANDYADENVVLEKLCVRFKTAEEGRTFFEAFEYAKSILKNKEAKQNANTPVAADPKPKPTSTGAKPKLDTPNKDSFSTPNSQANSLGGFVFTSTPTFKPKTDVKTDTPEKQASASINAKQSPFASFSFGTAKSDTQPAGLLLADKVSTEFKPVQKHPELNIVSKESLISPKPVVKSAAVPDNSQQDDDEEFVPTADFKPVIPLPDLVEVKTGEENCEILYEVKAKLLRFDSTSKEWKERGVGIMKILKEKNTYRLLMRREQVHKVCCNHQLLKSMVFTNMPKNNKVLNWCAQDFSENTLKPEMFAIRFRTPELCEEFLKHIHMAQEMMNSSNNVVSSYSKPTNNAGQSSSWGDKFKPKDGNWECGACYVNNDGKNDTCVSCGSQRDGSNKSDNAQSPQKFKPSPAPQLPPSSFGDKFKQKVGTWECKNCYVHNDGKKNYCEACDSPKNTSMPSKDTSVDLNASGNQFSFGIPSNYNSAASGDTNKSVTTTPTVATTTPVASGWGDKFKPKVGSWECKACYITNDAGALYCVACDSPKDDTVPKKESAGLDLGSGTEQKFSFGMPAVTTTPKAGESIFGSKVPPAFPFGATVPQSTTATMGFTFGAPKTPISTVSNDATGFKFGASNTPVTTLGNEPSGFSFGTPKTPISIASGEPSPATPLNLATKSTFSFSLSKPGPTAELATPKKDEFIFGSPNRHDFDFKPRSPRKSSGGDGDAESDGSGAEEECDNIYFKPVIPLPDKVEVRTGEEEEAVLYCHRAKLFRFGGGEWKERGLGDIKILKHPQTGKLR